MDTINQIIQALIFLVPGFIAEQIANRFECRQDYLRKDKEHFSATILGSSIIWLLYLSPRLGQEAWPDLKNLLSPADLWRVFAVSVLIGLLWGVARHHDLLNRVLRGIGLTNYTGEVPVWEDAVRCAMKSDRKVRAEVRMKDGLIYQGSPRFTSHEPFPRALYLQHVQIWEEELDGEGKINRTLLKSYPPDDGIYLEPREAEAVFFLLGEQRKPGPKRQNTPTDAKSPLPFAAKKD